MWLNLAKAETWKLLAPLRIAFTVAFGILWLMPWDKTQDDLLNARYVSQAILNLMATQLTWQQMKERIQSFSVKWIQTRKNYSTDLQNHNLINACFQVLSFRSGLLHSKYFFLMCGIYTEGIQKQNMDGLAITKTILRWIKPKFSYFNDGRLKERDSKYSSQLNSTGLMIN